MSPSKILVLKADDSEARDIRRSLESLGYDVCIVSRGEDVIKKALDFTPDLILMDIIWDEGRNDVEISDKIKKLEVPLIYLATPSHKKTMQKAKINGPYDYIIKPFDSTKLKIAIELTIYKWDMEMKLKEKESRYNDILHSEKKYRMLFDNAKDMITLNAMKENGLPGKFLEVNKVGLERLGYTRDEFRDMTPADIISLDKRADILKNAMELEKKGYSKFKIFHVTKTGKKIPVEVNNHIFEFNGNKIALAISRDITERERVFKKMEDSLKEKELLLTEIHHRVKNNMQIISSLLNLQKRYVDDENTANVLKESQNRVKSMAIIHEKLYQSQDINRINFVDYIRSLVSELFYAYYIDNHKIRPLIEVEDIKLNIETAVPLGLIISELVSNSLKYAFPSGKQGNVFISLQSRGDEFDLIIRDDGIGFPEDIEFKKTESFGLQLVNSLIKQIEGDIQLESGEGTSFIIKFKELNRKEINPT